MLSGHISPNFWTGLGVATHVAGAMVALATASWLIGRRGRFGPARPTIIASLFVTALWSLVVAADGAVGFLASLAEILRDIAWLIAVYMLFSSDGRHTTVKPIRPVLWALAFVEALHLGLELAGVQLGASTLGPNALFYSNVLLRLLVAVGGLVLLHNLYLGAAPRARHALRWPASALAAMWLFDLNLYTIAYLGNEWPAELAALRGLSVVATSLLIAVGATLRPETLRLLPSRAVTFQTASLMLIGLYFLAMFSIAEWLAYLGGDFSVLIEQGFLIFASVLAIFILPSAKLRGWLKVMLAKHLFQHRYDYRAEWLRFTATIGRSEGGAEPLEERAIKAVADIAESPAGLLLTPDDNGDLVLAARWQWPAAEVPAVAMSEAAARFFQVEGFIVDLDELRDGENQRGEAEIVPEWLREETRAWAIVPLIHYDRLTGVVLLARPPYVRRFDWEDFDLLRVVGQQLATYLAEHSGQQALEEAARFDDFHRRIAFVMHDIKNLASQLSLLARNAELHAEKPAFREDMLVTLRNSSEKLNALLARLSRYGGGAVDQLAEIDGRAVIEAVVERFRGVHPVLLAQVEDCKVAANRDSLEQVLVHLVQNAVDASKAEAAVFISLVTDGMHGRFEVLDSGHGMSPDFIRTKLFKPFVSSKPGGFGIGALEARDLVRAMNGRLEVESREGLGSRFTVRLPLAEASGLLKTFANTADLAGTRVA
jgi:putative PEP-CTERM system histidine kinase